MLSRLLLPGFASGAPCDVFLRARISAHPSQAVHVQRPVGLPVATSVEAMSDELAGRLVLRRMRPLNSGRMRLLQRTQVPVGSTPPDLVGPKAGTRRRRSDLTSEGLKGRSVLTC
jgi:hypothetical protein